jgi:hypothetical protein
MINIEKKIKSPVINFSITKDFIVIYSREDRIRTCDPLVPNQVLYQAELLPENKKMHPVGVEPTTF